MTKLFVIRPGTNPGALFPAAQSQNEFSKLPRDKMFAIDPKQPRNLAHLRLYWALVDLVLNNQDVFKTKNQVDEAIKIGTGRYTLSWVHDEHGDRVCHYHTESISVPNMKQAEFDTFWNNVLDYVAERIIPGLDKATFTAEVEKLVGPR